MSEKEFFNQNPNALRVLKVGDDLFLADFDAEAKKFAKNRGLTVEVVERPTGKKVSKEEIITDGTT